MREIHWIAKGIVIALHDGLIDRLGGSHGLLDGRKLEGALERPKNAQYYENINDPYELAGILVDAISNAHSFCDGNKRTALATAILFLEANGYIILYENEELDRFNDQAAELTERLSAHDEHQFTATDMADFFRKNVFSV